MRRLLLILLVCVPLLASAEPEVRVQSRLVPQAEVMVGGTLSLQVDLLVDTWFTAAPILPKLELPGALVTPPGGEAEHLNQQHDGKAFFGLRYTYQITPQAAQSFSIPALAFQVRPGQGDGLVTVNSQPLSFVAKAQTGAGKQQHLVANALSIRQSVQRSHDPLRVGDSVTRQVVIEAQGAQAMLIPPPTFAQVPGLKRYVQTPSVNALSDGRGGVSGGKREDSVTYVIGQQGKLSLPPIAFTWWDASSGQLQTATLDAVSFEAAKGSYQAPFSLNDDLRALGRQAHVRLSGHGVLLGVLLLVGGGLIYFARPWGRAALTGYHAWRQRRRNAWLASADYAWQLLRQQVNERPLQLSALYLWVRRSSGKRTLSAFTEELSDPNAKRSLDLLKIRFGPGGSRDETPADLLETLTKSRQQLTNCTDAQLPHGLKPLNP
ncbi:BatD family protein [Pseudomonas sp. H9]|uniref:BatD family protein n=1 Tax=Pseudomonas sp. H9 TaxID=483968 RepID=UPI0010581A6A|nr:BatD family protein [Pseudomonas sp. H9]TDF84331.1 hypothetical protein E1573_07310 [Pseudomonas sp. H9]